MTYIILSFDKGDILGCIGIGIGIGSLILKGGYYHALTIASTSSAILLGKSIYYGLEQKRKFEKLKKIKFIYYMYSFL